MPNIGTLLKQEISRLARREIRGQVRTTKKASAQYRRHIAALRRQVAMLERQLTVLQRRVIGTSSTAAMCVVTIIDGAVITLFDGVDRGWSRSECAIAVVNDRLPARVVWKAFDRVGRTRPDTVSRRVG